jgi:hypothetical protein
MTTAVDREPTLTAALIGVGVCGALATGVALAGYGGAVAFGVMLGALLALSNLWVHARVVKMYLAGGGSVWAVIGLVKVTLLFGLVYLLVKKDVVGLMPLIAGYGALPLGILASHLRPAPGPITEER